MSRLCGLALFAVLAIVAVIDPAFGQATESRPTVAELLQRLDELEGRTGQPPPGRERGLALMLEDVQLTNTNLYGPDGIRYFAARLLAINLTDEPIAVPTARITLIADDHERTLDESRAQLSRSTLQIGDHLRRFPTIPETLDVPPSGTASTWLVFGPIESAAAVPSLLLKAAWDGGAAELNINAYERGVLGLRSERLGPEDCAALVTIHGELNSVNSRTLTDELDALSGAGVMRVVVDWGPSAPQPDDQVLGWLANGTSPNRGMQYSEMPHIPVTLKEFHTVQQGERHSEQYFVYDATTPTHRTSEEAMSAALQTAFDAVPRELLRDELAHGHRLSRGAALAHAGARLGRRELPLVLAACDDPDAYTRQQAFAALGQYGETKAIDRLLSAAAASDRDMARAAISSLAGSRYPQAHRALSKLLDSLEDSRISDAIDILANHPRAEWIRRIAGFYESSDPQLRRAALRSLVRLDHPRIVEFLEAAISSSDAELRSEAYTQLAQRTDARSEGHASRYALQLLKHDRPDATTYALLMRTRDQRALAPLLKHLDAQHGGNEQIIELIAQLGGANAIAQLVERYPRFTPAEKAIVLNQMQAAQLEGLRPLAVEALSSELPQLVDIGVRILTTRPDDDTVRLLAQALDKAETANAWMTICNGLATVGSSEARAALMAVRDEEDRGKREQVIGALRRIKHTSPAYRYSIQASRSIEQGQQEKALKLLALALKFDPEYAEAYSQRGHLQLLQQNYSAAKTDFDRASELDPFDSLAVTGSAIVSVMQGDADAGIKQVRAAADKFPGDSRFEYNTACVYGRAVEALQSSSTAEARQQREEYQTAALRHLRNALQFGFDMPEFIRADPDLAVLHDVPEFQELLASSESREADEGAPQPPDEDVEFDVRSLR